MIEAEQIFNKVLKDFQANGDAALAKEKLIKLLYAYLSAGLSVRLAGLRRLTNI